MNANPVNGDGTASIHGTLRRPVDHPNTRCTGMRLPTHHPGCTVGKTELRYHLRC